MTKHLTRRALATGFAAALLLGGAACGDDDADTGGDTGEDSGVVDGMGGTDPDDSGIETGEGLGGGDEGVEDDG